MGTQTKLNIGRGGGSWMSEDDWKVIARGRELASGEGKLVYFSSARVAEQY